MMFAVPGPGYQSRVLLGPRSIEDLINTAQCVLLSAVPVRHNRVMSTGRRADTRSTPMSTTPVELAMASDRVPDVLTTERARVVPRKERR